MAQLKQEWIKKRAEQYAQNPKTSNYQVLVQGLNKIEIDMSIPPTEALSTYKNERTGKFPTKTTYTLIGGKLLTVPEGLDREIVAKLMEGITAITINRIGTEKQTRYQVV